MPLNRVNITLEKYSVGDKVRIKDGVVEAARSWSSGSNQKLTFPIGHVFEVGEECLIASNGIRVLNPEWTEDGSDPYKLPRILSVRGINVERVTEDVAPKRCVCPIITLMASGCQCGGN